MKKVLYMSILSLTFASNVSAQRCTVRENYAPIGDTLSWILGKRDRFELYINKTIDRQVYLSFSILCPVKLMTSIGDSIKITLENGKVIRTVNCKNINAKAERINAVFAELEFRYFIYLIHLNKQDLYELSKSEIINMSLTFQSAINPTHEVLKLLADNSFKESVIVTLEKETLKMDFQKISRRFKRALIKYSKCALHYTGSEIK